MLSVFTTRACGNAFWIRSPSESFDPVKSDGGIPCEESSGFATSMRTLPRRFSPPAAARASSDPAPFVQLNTISPNAAASANVP